ncbi:MAG: efflux RND transporter periplasmic adaptor subunit [Bacillota bacterium]
MIKKHWKSIIVILVILLIAGGVYFRISNNNQKQSKETINEENVISVSKGKIYKTIDGEGYIEANKTENLSFPSNGSGKKITAIHVDEGDQVEKGEVLIELDKREARLNYIQKKNALENAKISGSTNEVEEAELNLEIAKEQLDNLSLKAPFSALVTDINLEEGNYYDGNKALTVKDTSRLKAEINIEESNFQDVALGQKARIELDSFPDTNVDAEVSEIENEADNSGGTVTLPVTVTLDKVSHDIKLNSSAEVEIIVDKVEDVLTVPITAIFNRNNQEAVLKVVDDKTEVVPVETGLSDGLKIEVKSGINEGDKILLNTYSQSDSSNMPTNFPGGPPGGGMRDSTGGQN